MPTIIKYEQANPVPGKELSVYSPDMFILHMNCAFGAFPIELNEKHIERLEGMRATWSDVATNPYLTLIVAIKRLGTIKIWADYPTTEKQPSTKEE